MAANSKIEWCHHTWSPHRGCCKVSPGCANCFAEAGAKRNPKVMGEWGPTGHRAINANWGLPLAWNHAAEKAGTRLRVFPSLCDWLEDRPDLIATRGRFLNLIDQTPNLDWLLLTKRPEGFHRRLEEVVEAGGLGRYRANLWLDGRAPENVWLGVSVEDQEYADLRIPKLLETPASLRWVSYEPALGPVDWTCCQHEGETEFNALNGDHGVYRPLRGRSDRHLDWIVVGGESGAKARPFDIDWATATVEQCRAAGVPVFVKQMGSAPIHRPGPNTQYNFAYADRKGGNPAEWPPELQVREMPRGAVA